MKDRKLYKFDLEERTFNFSVKIISLAKKIDKDMINCPIINQLIKAGTSIGANYSEANSAETRKDFEHKIRICKKESKETKYWLSLLKQAIDMNTKEIRFLLNEAN